jgi:hypothetical protein
MPPCSTSSCMLFDAGKLSGHACLPYRRT